MSAEAETSRLNNNQRQKLGNRIHDIAPLLQFDGPFTCRDVDTEVRTVVELLHRHGALERVGDVKVTRDYDSQDRPKVDFVNQWQFRPAALEWLRERLADTETFPCGHRAHICNPRDVDGFSCRECLDEGKTPEYDRALLEECGVA